MSIQLRDGFQGQPLDRVLEDVLVRFVLFAQPPEDEPERIFFDMELALWFYVDLVRTEHPHLQNFKIKSFCKKLTEICPLLWESDVEDGLKKWSGYKSLVPVRGVALFDKTLTKLMLIQGIESRSWSFPRGKIEQNETDAQAAIREAMEEVGLDVKPYLNESDYIERTLNGKNYKIFLCKNIPDDVAYRPTVRNEINAINWKNFKALMKEIRKSQGNYFLVNTMIGQLNQWAKKQRGEINENEIRLEVEEKLKALLGVGEQPVNDPGRELLDMLRKSTAKKQLQVQQAHQMPLPFPSFPVPPMQGYAFHPPTFHQFQQIAFNSPFTPPVLPPHGLGPIPQLPPFAFNSMLGSPLIQRAPPVMQQPPSIAQLQRPSISMRNDVGSAELLGLLNKKSDKKPDEKKPEVRNENSTTSQKHKNSLLALLGKATPKPGSQISDDASAQVPPQTRSSEPQEKSVNDSSLELMELLKSKKMQHNGRSTPPVSNGKASSPERVDSPKPKFKILKRNENIELFSSSAKYVAPQKEPLLENDTPAYSFKGDRKAPPPSKELLELIKQSHKDDDAEVFEDFTDEEYNDYDADEVADDYEESTAEVLCEEHKKPNDPPVVVEIPGEVQANAPKKFTILKRQPNLVHVPSVVPVEVQSSAPKKFTILKRKEELNATEPETAPKPEPEPHVELGHDDEARSTVSTIRFSDDSEEEDYHDSFEGSTEEAHLSQQLENNQAKKELLNLLHGASKEVTPAPAGHNLDISSPSLEAANNPLTETSRSARDDLLGLLHKKKEEPVTSPSAPLSDPSSDHVKRDLLSLLNKPLTPQMEYVAAPFSPEALPPPTKPGADLLNLLHRSPPSKSSNPAVVSSGIPPTASHDQSHDQSYDHLPMLHKKPVTEVDSETSPAAVPVVSHESISPSSGLMNTLHKAQAPPKQPAGQTPAEQEKPIKHSTNLLNLLFKR